MTQFYDDFSGHSTSDVANNAAPTGISGWTWSSATSGTYQNATIVADAGALGGQHLRLYDSGWGGNIILYVTALGSVSGAVDALVKFRLATTTPTYTQHGHVQVPIVKANTSSLSNRNAVGFMNNSGTFTQQAWYFQGANEWTAIGSTKDVTSTFVAGDWWWIRMQVDGSNVWQWRSWADGDSEPGTWDVSGQSNSILTSGYLGVGSYEQYNYYNPIDIDYIAFGTAGDSAPEPSGGGGGGGLPIPVANQHFRNIGMRAARHPIVSDGPMGILMPRRKLLHLPPEKRLILSKVA